MRKPTNFPWLVMSDRLAEDEQGLGGEVVVAKAGAALNIGDAVFISAARTVNKSAVAADYEKRLGIIVGGAKTGMRVHQEDGEVGIQAAASGELVLVCVRGFCKAIAGAAIAAGDRIVADTVTAGRVNVGATITATENFTIASGVVAVTSTAANGDIIAGAITMAGAGFNRIIGQAWTAAAGAASKFIVFVNPA